MIDSDEEELEVAPVQRQVTVEKEKQLEQGEDAGEEEKRKGSKEMEKAEKQQKKAEKEKNKLEKEKRKKNQNSSSRTVDSQSKKGRRKRDGDLDSLVSESGQEDEYGEDIDQIKVGNLW